MSGKGCRNKEDLAKQDKAWEKGGNLRKMLREGMGQQPQQDETIYFQTFTVA